MISILLKSIMYVLGKLVFAMGSRELIEWVLFYVAKHIVATTKTKHDDVFYEKIVEAYNKDK